jgi:hypothetical protein
MGSLLQPILSALQFNTSRQDPFDKEVRAKVAQTHPHELIADEALPALAPATRWYFAYGSNLSSKVFEGRRGIKPLQALPCTLRGFTLAFDLPGIPWFEPAMGNLRACWHGSGCEKCLVHGIAYRISAAQLEHLWSTELSYYLAVRRAETYPQRHSIDVEVLLVRDDVELLPDHLLEHARPSTRYLNLLRTGAKEHGLHEDWVAYLHALPAAPPVAKGLAVFLGGLLLVPALVYVVLDRLVLRLVLARDAYDQVRLKLFAGVKRVLWGLWHCVHGLPRSLERPGSSKRSAGD